MGLKLGTLPSKVEPDVSPGSLRVLQTGSPSGMVILPSSLQPPRKWARSRREGPQGPLVSLLLTLAPRKVRVTGGPKQPFPLQCNKLNWFSRGCALISMMSRR